MSVYIIDIKTLSVGDILPDLKKEPITQVQLVKYAGASGDFNPLHTVDAFGQQAGFGGVIAHGMLIMGFVGQAITTWIERKKLIKFGVRFVTITRPGDEITVRGVIKDLRQENGKNIVVGDINAIDQSGVVKLSGYFEAYV